MHISMLEYGCVWYSRRYNAWKGKTDERLAYKSRLIYTGIRRRTRKVWTEIPVIYWSDMYEPTVHEYEGDA